MQKYNKMPAVHLAIAINHIKTVLVARIPAKEQYDWCLQCNNNY